MNYGNKIIICLLLIWHFKYNVSKKGVYCFFVQKHDRSKNKFSVNVFKVYLYILIKILLKNSFVTPNVTTYINMSNIKFCVKGKWYQNYAIILNIVII